MIFLLLLPTLFALELPRGVPLSRSAFYRVGKPFSCLDGSATVSWTKINDDYCDCADGTDEPGTAACKNGVFYCRDVQYKLQSIPSAYVNDGFCDCCDGSDEYDGRTTCDSTCGVLAAAVQQAKSIRRNEIEQGHKLFKEYVEQLKIRQSKEEQERAAAEEAAKLSSENHTEPDSVNSSETDKLSPISGSDDSTTTPEYGDTSQSEDDHGGDHPTDGEQTADAPSVDDEIPHQEQPEPVASKPEPKPVDYGPEGAFHMLDDMDKCLEFSDQQYIYELCGFREVFQRDNSASGNKISLGKWNDWAYSEDDVLKENKYAVMLFQDGLTCWNGPARSTKVYVHCGAASEIISVVEPSRCEYVMHLRTPAACYEDPDVLFKRLHPEDGSV